MTVRRILVRLSLVVGLASIAARLVDAFSRRGPCADSHQARPSRLGDTVDPPDQAGHTTYRLAAEPELGVLWTYAEPCNGVLTSEGGVSIRKPTTTAKMGL